MLTRILAVDDFRRDKAFAIGHSQVINLPGSLGGPRCGLQLPHNLGEIQ